MGVKGVTGSMSGWNDREEGLRRKRGRDGVREKAEGRGRADETNRKGLVNGR